MQTTRITTKGQITIPAAIRRKLDLKPGEQMGFSIKDEKIILQAVPSNIEDSFGLVSGKQSVSLADMEQIISKQGSK